MTKVTLTGCETYSRGNSVFYQGEGPYTVTDEIAEQILSLKNADEKLYFSVVEETPEEEEPELDDKTGEALTTETTPVEGSEAVVVTVVDTPDEAAAPAVPVVVEEPVVVVAPAEPVKAPSKKDKAKPVTVK